MSQCIYLNPEFSRFFTPSTKCDKNFPPCCSHLQPTFDKFKPFISMYYFSSVKCFLCFEPLFHTLNMAQLTYWFLESTLTLHTRTVHATQTSSHVLLTPKPLLFLNSAYCFIRTKQQAAKCNFKSVKSNPPLSFGSCSILNLTCFFPESLKFRYILLPLNGASVVKTDLVWNKKNHSR